MEEKVLAKAFKGNTGVRNPCLEHTVVSNVVPVLKQCIKDNAGVEDLEDCNEEIIKWKLLRALRQMQVSQSKSLVRLSKLQQELLKQYEVVLKAELSNRGIKGSELDVSLLESQKVKMLHQKITEDDENTLMYLQYFSQSMCEMGCGTPVDREDYILLQESFKQLLLLILKTMTQKQHNLAAVMTVQKTVYNYFFEERFAATTLSADSVIGYDPLFSLPKGVQPSEILKIRLQRWTNSKVPGVNEKSDFVQTLVWALEQMLPKSLHDDEISSALVTIHLHSNQKPRRIDISLGLRQSHEYLIMQEPASTNTDANRPMNASVDQSNQSLVQEKRSIRNMLLSDFHCLPDVNEDLLPAMVLESEDKDMNHTPKSLAQSVCLKHAAVTKYDCYDWAAVSLQSLEQGHVDDVKSFLSTFALGLLTSSNADFEHFVISVRYSKKLLDCDYPQLAIPLLITVLEHAVCKVLRKKAYHFLVDAIKLTMQLHESVLVQRWFIQAVRDSLPLLISNDHHSSDLPSLATCMCSAFDHVLKTKLAEVVKMAVEEGGVHSVPFKCILEQLLTLYKSIQKQNGAGNVTAAIKDPGVSLDFLVQATWQNPNFHVTAARAALLLFPELKQYKYIFHVQSYASLQLMHVTRNDLNIHQQEARIRSQVTKGEMTHSQAALWYLDLMQHVCCKPEKILCLLKSAMYFECELARAKLVSEKVALKNAALTCVYDACQLSTEMHPGMRVFTFQCALEATIRLGTADYTVSTEGTSDAVLAAGMFKNLIYNRQFTFLWNIPATIESFHVCSAHYIHHISYLAHRTYLQNLRKLDEHMLPLKGSLLHYQCFENVLSDQSESESSILEKRIHMMSKFLKEIGWTHEDVSQRMTSPYMPRDESGWLLPKKSLGSHLQIAELKGFSLTLSDSKPSIQLLFEPAKDGNGLLSFEDVFTILHLDSNEVFPIKFSLDPPSTTERFHPFNSFRCHPSKLQKTSFMDTLFQADYLLKFFSTGTEVSAKPPFHLRSVLENLVRSIPKHLKHVLRPPYLRGYSHMTRHRSWIEAEAVLFDEETSTEQVSYFIQSIKLVVRNRPLVRGVNGQCYDAMHTDSGPHAQFAADFTDNYDEISKYFPIFARLRELGKLQFMMQKIYAQLNTLKETSQTKCEALLSELSRLRSLVPIKERYSECNWVPAVYTIRGRICMVYGGVTLEPSHKNYYTLYGNDVPDSEDTLCWKDVYNNVVNSIKCLEIRPHGPGGIYFGITDHCRVPIYITDPENIVCVKLGTAATTTASESDIRALNSDSSTPFSHRLGNKLEDKMAEDFPVDVRDRSPEASNLICGQKEQTDQVGAISNTSSCQKESSPGNASQEQGSDHSESPPAIVALPRDKLSAFSPNKVVNVSSPLSSFTPSSIDPQDRGLEEASTDTVKGDLEPLVKRKGDTCVRDFQPSVPKDQTDDISACNIGCPEGANIRDSTSKVQPPSMSKSSHEKVVDKGTSTSLPAYTHSNYSVSEEHDPSDTNLSQLQEERVLPNFSDKRYKSKSRSSLDVDQAQHKSLGARSHLSGEKNSKDVTPHSEVATQDIANDSVALGDPSLLSVRQSDNVEATKSSKTTKQFSTKWEENLVVKPTILSSDNVSVDNYSETGHSAQNSTSGLHLDASEANRTVVSPNISQSFDDLDSGNPGPTSPHSANLSATLDPFFASFCKNPLNVAVFGEVMHNAGMNITATSSTCDMNKDFHPDAFIREQVKNVIVLRNIIDAYHKQGVNPRIAMQ